MEKRTRTALVTGAASGIGAAVALALGRAGDDVVIAAVDRDAEALRGTVAKLAAAGVRAEGYVCDVTDAARVASVVDEVENRLGPVESLVNAAGVLRTGAVADPDSDFGDEDWDALFSVNAKGVFHVSRAVVRHMTARRRGAIVTVASNAAGTPRHGMAAYAASKAAAAMFTKSLGLEVAPYGIRCNVVAPGSTDTPMLSSMWTERTTVRSTIEGSLDTFKLGIPLGKLGRAEDVAQAVAFLLSEQAGHITLHELTVDGGATLGR
ncbi:2,3-dihydro-2,3-dihydroxybenzoate dehydrogenase [Streptomyces morookaense]|uniref:2,3-dihydro-2,3-dihydroxybenzoate dehydrogenase n=1 Tax=Streptomyces morookaense TaxID=1970 RepID=A0A7Y7E898_STRMO|nr:2,3-dihydro-2,3-dihydroxybenzoate dehydrogenase [Streptomyces morookaense]NVK79231.1 2,3-dihydro-2,3-dihydroxybenzoate dehydrogenase [Streptomyces morookaense]GHF27596.1 2,3-dihydro-2,3-dihydroxybenzoate dehydrogenase [Streptomyces morookaense]